MDIKSLLGLRPKAETIGEVEAAIARARASAADAKQREEACLAVRGDMLINGSEADVQTAERNLAEARAEQERAEAIIPALERKLAVLQRQARIVPVQEAVAEANRLVEVAEKALRTRYPALVEALVREVLEPELRAYIACRRAERLRLGLIDLGADAGGDLTIAPSPYLQVAGDWPRKIHPEYTWLWQLITLPSADKAAVPGHPNKARCGRPRWIFAACDGTRRVRVALPHCRGHPAAAVPQRSCPGD